MSDITIPGVTSKINSDKIIEGLMKVERIPLERLEERNEVSKQQKQTWQALNRKITTLRDSARKLYSFQNPFDDKRVYSSDDSVLTATADRNAAVEKRALRVIETASADKFVSKPVPGKEKVEAGNYTFFIGEKKISFNFRGGTIREFSDHINRTAAADLRSTVINYDRDNIVFVIESRHTGSANTLSFEEKSADFALTAGIIGKSQTSARNIDLTPAGIKEWTTPLSPQDYTLESNSVTLRPAKEISIQVSPSFPAGPQAAENMVLEFDVKIRKLPEQAYTPLSPPSGPALPEPGKMTYEDITIINNPFEASLPEWKPPAEPEKITDMSVLFLNFGGRVERIESLKDTEETQKIRIPMSEYSGNLTALNIRNRNTHREITVSGIRIYNPEERGEYVPLNPASKASDAVVDVEGIRITRSSNKIDDLIPGVTLNLHSPGGKNIELDIKPDRETIKDAVIELVGNYNNLVAELNILSRHNEDIVNELGYLSEDERKSAMERMGIFQGEVSITQIRDRLQRIMTSTYPWNDENLLTHLAHLGISTNTSAVGTSSASRLRGYLEIDEQKLDSAIDENGARIKNLFGFDRDSDMVTDSGLAFEVDNYLRAYNETGGIVALKISTIDRNINRTDTEITNLNRKLTQLERDLRRKYGMMEGALQDLEKTSTTLQNMSPNNSSR